ncbi:MAG: signal peptidase I [Bacilli bacterium]|nr:signal peptidase I [Bacilli bacterium]
MIKKNNPILILWKIIKGIATILIVLIVLTIFIQRLSNNKLSLAGYSIYTVVTQSMVPKYQVGDMLLSKSIDPDTIKIGDDVTYQGKEGDFAGKIVTHQVIAIDGTGPNKIFHTKGIANTAEDPTITGDQIYGKVVTKLTVLSIITKIISNIYGMFFFIIVPVVVIIFGIIMDVVNDRKTS